jgi:steroid 5-alpha reductase family enzyme
MGEVLLANGLVALGLMFVTWLLSLRLRDVSIVDVVWGLGFVVIGWITYLLFTPAGDRRWALLVLAMVTAWGLRLSIYIGLRKRGKGEDYRYQAMREKAPTTFPRDSLFRVFLLQAGLMWVVSLPLQAAVAFPLASVGFGLWIGLPLYLLGLFFEAAGDWQLSRFKADPANQGKVMDRGLWRYTRHPNYFGDFCVWWAISIFAFDNGHWWTVLGPIVMTVLLMRVSGAGLLEKTIGQRRPGYDEYAARTNAFFPGPSRG